MTEEKFIEMLRENYKENVARLSKAKEEEENARIQAIFTSQEYLNLVSEESCSDSCIDESEAKKRRKNAVNAFLRLKDRKKVEFEALRAEREKDYKKNVTVLPHWMSEKSAHEYVTEKRKYREKRDREIELLAKEIATMNEIMNSLICSKAGHKYGEWHSFIDRGCKFKVRFCKLCDSDDCKLESIGG